MFVIVHWYCRSRSPVKIGKTCGSEFKIITNSNFIFDLSRIESVCILFFYAFHAKLIFDTFDMSRESNWMKKTSLQSSLSVTYVVAFLHFIFDVTCKYIIIKFFTFIASLTTS